MDRWISLGRGKGGHAPEVISIASGILGVAVVVILPTIFGVVWRNRLKERCYQGVGGTNRW